MRYDKQYEKQRLEEANKRKALAQQQKAVPTQQRNSEQEKRVKPKKRRRQRRKKNYTLNYILLTIIATITLIILSYTVFFNITKINVINSADISHEQIIKISGVKVGDNMLKVKQKNIEEKILKGTINIDAVEVKKKFPSTLNIKLIKAKPKASIRFGRRFYYLSNADRLIEISDTNTHPDVPTIQGIDLGETTKLGNYFAADEKNNYDICQTLLDAIKAVKLTDITFIEISDIANIRIFYKDKIEVKIGNISEIEYKLKVTKEIIETKLGEGEQGVLDVQLNGKSFYRQTEVIIPYK